MTRVPAVTRKEDHRHVGHGQDALHQLQPVGAGQYQVQQHQVGPFLFHQPQRLLGRTGDGHGVAGFGQGVPQVAQCLGVVVHRQHPHPLPSPAGGAARRAGQQGVGLRRRGQGEGEPGAQPPAHRSRPGCGPRGPPRCPGRWPDPIPLPICHAHRPHCGRTCGTAGAGVPARCPRRRRPRSGPRGRPPAPR